MANETENEERFIKVEKQMNQIMEILSAAIEKNKNLELMQQKQQNTIKTQNEKLEKRIQKSENIEIQRLKQRLIETKEYNARKIEEQQRFQKLERQIILSKKETDHQVQAVKGQIKSLKEKCSQGFRNWRKRPFFVKLDDVLLRIEQIQSYLADNSNTDLTLQISKHQKIVATLKEDIIQSISQKTNKNRELAASSQEKQSYLQTSKSDKQSKASPKVSSKMVIDDQNDDIESKVRNNLSEGTQKNSLQRAKPKPNE